MHYIWFDIKIFAVSPFFSPRIIVMRQQNKTWYDMERCCNEKDSPYWEALHERDRIENFLSIKTKILMKNLSLSISFNARSFVRFVFFFFQYNSTNKYSKYSNLWLSKSQYLSGAARCALNGATHKKLHIGYLYFS